MSHDKSSPDFLYHHFYDVDQQYETSKLGMWAFILTEILTFGALFVAYTISVSYTHLTLPTILRV